MERFNISKKCMRLLIIRNIAITILLIFCYLGILLIQMRTWVQVLLLLIHGFVVALFLGHLWIIAFLKVMRNQVYQITTKRKETIDTIYVDTLGVPPWVVGFIERTFFGLLVAFDIQATAAAMGTWILVKMATDWHRVLPPFEKDKHNIGPRSLAFVSLLAGMISLFFALIGGLICRMALNYCLSL